MTPGEFQRALLAWERVIDLTKPDETQAAAAISAIKRLRPTLPNWNTSPESAIAIELHAGTGKTMAKTLTPVLESVARDVEAAVRALLFELHFIDGLPVPRFLVNVRHGSPSLLRTDRPLHRFRQGAQCD